MVEHAPGQVVAHIRSSLPSLLPAEQAVPAVFLAHTQKIVEFSSQQVAELAGASRATVVRTCQSLKYSGYQYCCRHGGRPGRAAQCHGPFRRVTHGRNWHTNRCPAAFAW